MSGPLKSLKKTKKPPLHLNLEEETKRLNIPFRPVPTIGLRETSPVGVNYTEDESKLLDEITQNLASKRMKKRSDVTNPFHEYVVKDRPGEISPKSSLKIGPTDAELLSLMTSRLHQLELRVQHQDKEIMDKEKRIQLLQEKVKLYHRNQAAGSWGEAQDLRTKCQLLQNQVQDMEAFLADYGMAWVGAQSDPGDMYLKISADPGGDMDDEDDNTEEDERSHEGDVPHDVTPALDFDLMLKNIDELNHLAGDGVAKILKTEGGAKLKMPDPVPLTFYANGLVMFSGPFRPYSDVETQACIRDLLEGFFPYELKETYPDGIPFKVTDKRDVFFDDKRLTVFTGEGQMLGGETKPSRLVPTKMKEKSTMITEHDHGKTIAIQKHNHGKTTEIQKHNHGKTTEIQKHHKVESTLPGPKLTVDQFLNKLPASVVKHGKVIDIRSSVANNLQGGDQTEGKVIVVETQETTALLDRLKLAEGERLPSARNNTTLRIKSARGDTTYLLKMKSSDNMGQVREYLSQYHQEQDYDLVSAYPKKTFDDNLATLQECGLVPNATLHVKKRES